MKKQTYLNFGRPVDVCTLDNGLTVACNRIEFAFAKVDLTFCVGSYHDSFQGVAHFAEHLVAEGMDGSGIHPAVRPLILDGAEFSARTGYVRTKYGMEMLPERIPDAIGALFRICAEANFKEAHVSSERGIILDENRRDAERDGYEMWDAGLRFPHAYGLHHPIGGISTSVEHMQAHELNTFLQRSYVTQNALLCVTGSCSLREIMAVVRRLPESVFRQGAEIERGFEFRPRIVSETYVYRKLTSYVRFYVPDPENETHLKRFSLLIDVLCAYPFGLLYQRLRKKEGKIYSLGRDDGDSPKLDSGVRVYAPRQLFDWVVEQVMEELNSVRNGEMADNAYSLVIAGRRMWHAMKPLHAILSAADWFRGGWLSDDPRDVEDATEVVLSTTKEDLVEIANLYLRPEQIGIIRVHPPEP